MQQSVNKGVSNNPAPLVLNNPVQPASQPVTVQQPNHSQPQKQQLPVMPPVNPQNNMNLPTMDNLSNLGSSSVLPSTCPPTERSSPELLSTPSNTAPTQIEPVTPTAPSPQPLSSIPNSAAMSEPFSQPSVQNDTLATSPPPLPTSESNGSGLNEPQSDHQVQSEHTPPSPIHDTTNAEDFSDNESDTEKLANEVKKVENTYLDIA